MASWSLGGVLRGMFAKPTIDATSWDELETALYTADFGPALVEEILERLHEQVERYQTTDPADLQRQLREILEERLAAYDSTLRLTARPSVVLVVGVNGVGKTTTIGKFARLLRGYDRSVIVGAGDTFRAAAVEQLATWASRAGVEVVRPQAAGADPASVAYQTVERAVAVSADVAIIDTAGRLQTKAGLMDELTKIRRSIDKALTNAGAQRGAADGDGSGDGGAPGVAEVLLVLDATTGQNGLVQAEAFIESAGVTGLVLTKLDGSAKGGFVFAVQERTGIPVKLVGTGEGIGDLAGFNPVAFVQQLLA